MPKKPLSQQMQEAFLQSRKNGNTINRSLREQTDHINRNIDLGRNLTLNHLNENDRGFYIPKSEQYRKGLLDGDFIRKSHITEQDDLTDEEKKELKKQIAARNARTQELTDIALAGSGGRPRFDADSDEFAGRRNEADVRSRPNFDPTAPGASDQLRRAQVRDQMGRRGPDQGITRVSTDDTDWDAIKRQSEKEKRREEMEKYGFTSPVELPDDQHGPPVPADIAFDKRAADFEAEKARQRGDLRYQQRLQQSELTPTWQSGSREQRAARFAAARNLSDEQAKQNQIFRTQQQRARNIFMDRGSDFEGGQFPNLASRDSIARVRASIGSGTTTTGGGSGTTTTGGGGGSTTTGGGGSTTTGGGGSTTTGGGGGSTTTGGGGKDTFTPDPDSVLTPGAQRLVNTAGDVASRFGAHLMGDALPGGGLVKDDSPYNVFDPTMLDVYTGGLSYLPRVGTEALIGSGIFSSSAGADRANRDFEARERMRAMGSGGGFTPDSAEELAAKDQEAARQRARTNTGQGDLTDAEYNFQMRAMGVPRSKTKPPSGGEVTGRRYPDDFPSADPPSGGEVTGRRYPDDFPSADPPSGGEVSAQRLDPPAGMGVSPAGVDPNSGSAIQFPVTGSRRGTMEPDVGQRTPAQDMDSHVRDMKRIRSEMPFYNPIDAIRGRPTNLVSPEQAELRRRSREAQERARGGR